MGVGVLWVFEELTSQYQRCLLKRFGDPLDLYTVEKILSKSLIC